MTPTALCLPYLVCGSVGRRRLKGWFCKVLSIFSLAETSLSGRVLQLQPDDTLRIDNPVMGYTGATWWVQTPGMTAGSPKSDLDSSPILLIWQPRFIGFAGLWGFFPPVVYIIIHFLGLRMIGRLRDSRYIIPIISIHHLILENNTFTLNILILIF